MKVIGLDLAGKDTNPTGFCVLTDYGTHAEILYMDDEIVQRIVEQNPDLVAIDGPFGYPDKGYFRRSEQLLMERGFKPLSPKFPGMRPLVDRTKNLVKSLMKRHFRTIEVFTKATEMILGLSQKKGVNEHEYEALLAALTGKHFLEGNYEDLAGVIIPRAT